MEYLLLFQSTHSLRSATVRLQIIGADRDVSIHALLAECDKNLQSLQISRKSFNPRTPCGVRLSSTRDCAASTSFNPRTPCGVRHVRINKGNAEGRFQSTHSLRSATPAGKAKKSVNQFQSTHSLRSATLPAVSAGRFPAWKFQSTHSLRSATTKLTGVIRESSVSIHALLAECDRREVPGSDLRFRFNPRTPCGVRQ